MPRAEYTQKKNKVKYWCRFWIEGSFSEVISNAAVKLLACTTLQKYTCTHRVVSWGFVWPLPSWQWHDNAFIICLRMHRKLERQHLCMRWCRSGLQREGSLDECGLCPLKVNVDAFSRLLSYSSIPCGRGFQCNCWGGGGWSSSHQSQTQIMPSVVAGRASDVKSLLN